ncbi:MAG: tetratricopeptide repeat protein [Akkermansiaceae bacterium]
MKLWPLLSFLLIASQAALPGEGVAALRERGEDALASGLWEVAELRFSECLADPGLTADEKPQMAINLAESLIRGGKAAEALTLLDQSFLEKSAEVPFWKAQALAGMGRFADAAAMFSEVLLNPDAPHRAEAGFSQASLLLSLSKPDDALEVLKSLSLEDSPEISSRAKLLTVEILLDLGRTAEARETMPAAATLSTGDRPLGAFLEAHLMLAEGNFTEAAAAFQSLLSQPQGQSIARHHAAAAGLADALMATGDQEGAAKSLLVFVQEHPDSPLLDAMFNRLNQWLPEVPAAIDPILEQLAQWITPPESPALGAIAGSPPDADSAATSAWPTIRKSNDLLAFSVFTRAIGLHRMATPESRAEASRLMTRLRLDNPDHFLATRALYQTSRWLLDEGKIDRAMAVLDLLRDTAKSPILRGQAAFLEARTAYLEGNPELAIQLFDEAALALPDSSARTARLNAGIARLRSGNLKGVTLIQQDGRPDDAGLVADLTLERALATTPPSEARILIEEFLSQHPDHSRAAEARLAAAEAALAGTPPDLAFAKSQLDVLESEPDTALLPSRIAMARLRVADLAKDSLEAIRIARAILESHPQEPASAEAALTLGRNLFETKDYNPARLVLEKLAAADTDPGRAQAAWLLAARSAALVGTLSSKEEALVLFDKAIAADGPLGSIARLEKADHLIKNMYRFSEAAEFLRQWFDSLAKTDPLRLPAGLLLGQALYAQGATSPDSLKQALEIYDQLLPHAENHPALIHRLQYVRGLTLEQLPHETNPERKRDGQALNAYYSVLETPSLPTEWEYFELCGFKALSLLEKAERWPAAIAVAQKIASFKGPRAEEAANRADQLQLKHMIW